jgi:stage III sporulation protein AC
VGWRSGMDYLFILRIAVVGILVSILNQILKQSGRDELAFLTSLAGLILVLLWLLPHISDLFLSIQKLFDII